MTTFTSDAEALDALKEKYNALKFEIQKVMVTAFWLVFQD
jgi:hypothetical protein